MYNVKYSNIPQVLKEKKAWCVWRLDSRRNKTTGKVEPSKTPYHPWTMSRAASNRQGTWVSYSSVEKVLQSDKARFKRLCGIGFFLHDDYVGLDIDHCRDPLTGVIDDDALAIIREINTYTEISPSNTGVRMFARGVMPIKDRKNGRYEVYDKGSPRFLTVTGNHVDGTPTTVEERQPALDDFHSKYIARPEKPRAERQPSPDRPTAPTPKAGDTGRPYKKVYELCHSDQDTGAEFKELWGGKWAGKFPSHSEADARLVGLLAYYSGPRVDRIDVLFRRSGLMRQKWDELRGHDTYGNNTLAKYAFRDRYYDWSCLVEDIITPFEVEQPDHGSRLLTLSEMRGRAAAMKDKKIWAADRWIQAGKVGLFHGKAKRGKSTSLMDLTASIITGQKWLNLIQCRRMPVLMIDYENEEDYLDGNIVPMIESRGWDWRDCEDWLYVYDPQLVRADMAPFNVDKVCGLIETIQRRTGHTTGEFFVDTARPAFNGLWDESNWEWAADRVRYAIDLSHQVKVRTGWGGIIVHHDTKAGSTASGSGDWEGAVDYSISYDLNQARTEATMTWTGRQIEPPNDVVYTKTGAVLTGQYKDLATHGTDALIDIRVKSFVTSVKQSQTALILIVKNGWKSDIVPGEKAIIASLKRLSDSGEISTGKGVRNLVEYWV